MWLLREVSWPHVRRHRARTALTFLGIALGVAAVVATTGVTDAYVRSFRRGVEAQTGRAELHVSNGGAGVPSELVDAIAGVRGVADATAVVEGFVALAGGTIAVFGVDDGRVPASEHPAARGVVDADAVALGRAFAEARGYAVGDVLEVIAPGGRRALTVGRLLDAHPLVALHGGAVGVLELGAAQRLLAREGKVDRVAVRVVPGAPLEGVALRLEAVVGGRARVEPTAESAARGEDLLASMRVAVAVAGLVGLLVGFFLIHHTVSVSMVQRRTAIGMLQALGVSRARLLGWLASEALVLGTLAAAAGLAGGVVLARLCLETFGGVADVWMRVAPAAVTATPALAALAGAVGLGVTLAATLVPAWRVAGQPIVRTLRDVPPADPASGGLRRASAAAIVLFTTATGLVACAPRSLPYAPLVGWVFGVNAMLLAGFALLSPIAARVLGRIVTAAAERRRGTVWFLAGSALARRPAAPVAVVAAVVVGLGWVVVDVSLVASLERSWLRLLDVHQRSDLVVQGSGPAVSLLTHPPFPESVVDAVAAVDGVVAVQGIRLVETTIGDRPAVIQAIDPSPHGLARVDGPWDEVAARFWAGEGVAASENLAHRTGLAAGDTVTLATPAGAARVPVLGVFADIADSGDLGGVAIARHAFRDRWGDRLVSRIRVWIAPERDPETVRAAVASRFGPTHGLAVLTFDESRAAVSALVARAFTISLALALLALGVAVGGVVNFLLAGVLDRRAAWRTLAGVGVPASRMGGAVVAEGALVGVLGAGLGLVAGVVASRVLVLQSVPMINGWRFEHAFPLDAALGAAVAAVALVGLAALAPARLARRLADATEGGVE